MANSDDDWSLYAYEPNRPAPIAFAIILLLVAIYQFYQSFSKLHDRNIPNDPANLDVPVQFHWRKFGFMMMWASSVWIGGFVCRAISVYNTQAVNIFIAQFVLVLMGPPLYAAAEYFILGRLLAYLPYHAPLHPGRVIPFFALLSAAVESLTANGAANSGGDRDPSQRASGIATLKAALILQCFVELGFMSIVASVQRRCHKAGLFPKQIRPIFWILYLTSSMVLVRCIVRTIEGFEAPHCQPWVTIDTCGYVSRHEWILWVFEIANITLFVILLAVFHPGKYLPRDSRIFLDQIDGKTERVGPGFSKADKRPIWQTVVDPFGLYPTLTGKGLKIYKFWENEQPVYNGGPLPKQGKEDKVGRSSDDVKLSEAA